MRTPRLLMLVTLVGLVTFAARAESPNDKSQNEQVCYDIQILQLERTALAKLGVDLDLGQLGPVPKTPLQAIVGASHNNVCNLLETLKQNRVLKVLAEPSLVTVCGQPTWFKVGGEFPVPVPQADEFVTIEYKHFGTSVELSPTRRDDGRIRTKLRTRISELDEIHTITVDDRSYPGLRVRELETTLDLKPDEMVVLASNVQEHEVADESQPEGSPPLKVQTQLIVTIVARWAEP